MKRSVRRVRSIVGVSFAAATLAGCSSFLDVAVEGQITDATVNNPASADALRVGVLGLVGSLTNSTNGATLGAVLGDRGLWHYTGMLADEWKASSSNQEIPLLDRRISNSTNAAVNTAYSTIHQTRSRAREAIDALQQFLPTPLFLGQMYFALALSENGLAEAFCNGTPLSGQVNGVVVYGQPLTNAEVFTLANAHADTTLSYLTATDAATVELKRAMRILKARVLVNLGGAANFTAAAALVNGIATNFVYAHTYSASVTENATWWLNNGSVSHAQVGDSVNPDGATVLNSMPFGSAGDPRVPVLGSSRIPSPLGVGNDNQTPIVHQQIWQRTTPTNVFSGVDARLIEAEAQLQLNTAGGRAAMLVILNQLRATTIALSTNYSYTANALPPLAAPADQNAAIRLYFREKAFWTFARGQRLGDMRRMVRQYGFAENQVFPTGNSHVTNSPHGTGVNFPIPTSEQNNPNITNTADFCIDRNA